MLPGYNMNSHSRLPLPDFHRRSWWRGMLAKCCSLNTDRTKQTSMSSVLGSSGAGVSLTCLEIICTGIFAPFSCLLLR